MLGITMIVPPYLVSKLCPFHFFHTVFSSPEQVQEELYYPLRRRKENVRAFYVMGKALSGKLSCPCDRSCFIKCSCMNFLLTPWR